MQFKARIGKISYLNLVPFFKELKKVSSGKELEFISGVPKTLNDMLRDGSLDLSPASNVCLRDPSLNLFAPVGVKASGPVKSVYLSIPKSAKLTVTEFYDALEHKQQLHSAPSRVWVSAESEASVELCKRLHKKVFGADLAPLNKPGPDVDDWQLWIGDDALKKRNQFHAVIDLAEAWKKLSSWDFIFAVWIARKNGPPMPPKIAEALVTAARLADRQIQADPEAYWDDSLKSHGIDRDTVLAYWPHIRYELSSQDIDNLHGYLTGVTG